MRIGFSAGTWSGMPQIEKQQTTSISSKISVKASRVFHWITEKLQALVAKIRKFFHAFRLKYNKTPSGAMNAPFTVPKANHFTPAHGKKWTANDRVNVYQDSIQAMDHGYILKGKLITLDKSAQSAMLAGTKVYNTINQLGPIQQPFTTVFSLAQDDTLNVLLKLKSKGKNPVGINMAHASDRGGRVLLGSAAQEECLYRRSDYRKTHVLPEVNKAILKEGVIYTPSISVFREDESKGFAFMEAPVTVTMVSVAAFSMRSDQDLQDLNLPPNKAPSEAELRSNPLYVDGTKNRIRTMLRAMALHGHTELVLGALGCGAFLNPPKLVAELFQNVFYEVEFKGRFASVHFAVLPTYDKDSANVDAFNALCKQMNVP